MTNLKKITKYFYLKKYAKIKVPQNFFQYLNRLPILESTYRAR